MIIYPAIDLYAGQCVRLYQGDYQKITVYHADPLALAKDFIAQGAEWLHVVDLDGAKNPTNNQLNLITNLIQHTNINIQVGGGIRSKQQIKNLLDCGANRVIIGSMAVKNSREVKQWLNYFGAEHLVLALDVIIKQNQIFLATHAWQEISSITLFDLLEYYKSCNLKHILCTNIELDGTLQGPDYSLYENILKKFPELNCQASGGIQSLNDIKKLRENKLSGVIIGRALYEKKLILSEVLSC